VTRRALRIGAITISFECDDTFTVPEASSRFLISPDATPDVDIVVKRGTPLPPRGELVFDSGGTWRLYRDGDKNVYEFRSPVLRSDPYKTATFDAAFTRGEVIVADDAAHGIDPLEYPIDELLVGAILSNGAGVELHGVGIIDDGRGYLFVGQSGAGKTTTARLWLADEKPMTILSDDRIIVREVDGELRMYGTPWHGEAQVCAAADAPLEAIYLLEQAPKTEVREIDDADAVARLFACSFPLFYRPESILFTITFLTKIVHKRVVRVLAFAPDATAVRAVRR